MSELDAQLDEARQAIATMAPPQDLWARALERADAEAAVVELPVARRRVPRWLAVGAAAAACLLVVVAIVIADRDMLLTTDSASPSGEASGDDSTFFAQDVEIAGWLDDPLPTLSVDVVVQGGKAAGEFRVAGVVVTVQCARTIASVDSGLDGRDLVLGGQVTVNVNQLATLDEVDVAMGEHIALIIREELPAGQRVSLYDPSLWHGEQATARSCHEVVGSVPEHLDGGFFDHIVGTIRTP